MKKAFMKKGYIMQVKEDKKYNPKEYSYYYSFTKSKKDFLKNRIDLLYNTDLKDIKLLNEVNLYKVYTCKPDGNINILINFRLEVNNSNPYYKYVTIKDIKNLLDDGYVVAVEGIGEIDSIEDIK